MQEKSLTYAQQNEWRKKNMKMWQLSATLKSGIPQAMEKMNLETGEKPVDYIRRAVLNALKDDGYWEEPLVHPWDK